MKRILFVVGMTVFIFMIMATAVVFNKQRVANKNSGLSVVSHQGKSNNEHIEAIVDNGPTQ